MEWISVKDELPKVCQWVLVVYTPNNVRQARTEMAYLAEFFGRKFWYLTEIGIDSFEKVTHWMPLPEPPKE